MNDVEISEDLRMLQEYLKEKCISEEEVLRMLQKKPRGRPPSKKLKTIPKPRGRPNSSKKKENYMFIISHWVLLHDKIPKMKLKGILADALEVDDSYVSKCITRLNKKNAKGAIRIYRGGDNLVILGTPGSCIKTAMKHAAKGLPLPHGWHIL